MKPLFGILLLIVLTFALSVRTNAQCSVCSKTALQMGEKPAQGLNQGILYLMLMPFAVVGFIGYRWWVTNKRYEEQENKQSAMDNRQ
jgi:H+/Cl- antiporter ClcA